MRCHLEDLLLPGVSKASVAALLEARFGAAIGASSHGGRQLAGWYLQQFLKLGAAVSIPSLSTYYVVWDMDMILLRAPGLWGSAPRVDDDSAPRKVWFPGGVGTGFTRDEPFASRVHAAFCLVSCGWRFIHALGLEVENVRV